MGVLVKTQGENATHSCYSQIKLLSQHLAQVSLEFLNIIVNDNTTQKKKYAIKCNKIRPKYENWKGPSCVVLHPYQHKILMQSNSFNCFSSSLICINRGALGTLILCLFPLALVCMQAEYDRTQQMGCFSSLSHSASL